MRSITDVTLLCVLLASSLFSGIARAEENAVDDEVGAVAKSDGCNLEDAKLVATPGGESKRLKLGDRYLRVSLPERYDAKTPAPLILAFHDFNLTASEFESLTHLSDPRYNKDAVVVYPEAYRDGIWQSDSHPLPGINDITFTTKLLARMQSRICIDTNRIYATGLGTGGGMLHLLGCSPDLSRNITAYAAVNANLFAGVPPQTEEEEKSANHMLWLECLTNANPMRLLEIHSENNTEFDYWGEESRREKPRLPVIKWLIDWADYDGCGNPREETKDQWKGLEEGGMFKTDLEQGYIFEGFLESEIATKASYACWGKQPLVRDFKKRLDKKIRALRKKGKKVAEEEGNKIEDDAELLEKKKADLDEYVKQLKQSLIIEHYYLRGYAHGWPRVQMPKAKDAEGKYTNDRIEEVEWQDIELPDKGLELDFDAKDVFTFLDGYKMAEKPDPDIVQFDSTVRVLDWFRQFRMSDGPRVAPRNSEGLTEYESQTIDKALEEYKKTYLGKTPAPGEKGADVPAGDDTPATESEPASALDDVPDHERDEL